jgi:hypothetical protein
MKKKEIIEGNRLIAEFMKDYELITDKGVYLYPQKGFYVDELEYHSSWDWLMPVVEKISIDYSYYQSNDSKQWQVMIDVSNTNIVSENLIDAIYKAVVEFIKYNNKNG